MNRLRRHVQAPAGPTWVLTTLLLAFGTGLTWWFAQAARGPLWHVHAIAPPVLWAMIVLAEVFYVQVIFRREGYAFSLIEIPLVLGLWFSTGPALLVALLSGAAVAFVFYRRHRGLKLCFNLAHLFAQGAVAITVFQVLGPGDDPLQVRAILVTMAATGAAAVVAATSVSAAIALHQGRRDLGKLLIASIGGVVATLPNTSVGLIAVILAAGAPMAAVLLVPPAAVLVIAYHSLIVSRRKQESLEFLYEASRILNRGAAGEGPMTELLGLARGTFGAEMAEVTLYMPDDPSLGFRTAVGPGDDVLRMQSVHLAAHRSPDAAAVASRTVIVAELEGERRRLGTMVVAHPSASRRSFSTREVQLFSTLANQVAVALENGVLEASLAKVTALTEELHHRAFHDELTGLANRAMFVDALQRAVAHASADEAPAVLFADLDDFKAVNDTFGHAAGDTLLVEVAERLRQCVRPGDVPARLGGDEFAVLIVGRDAERAAGLVADRLLSSMQVPVAVGDGTIRVTASIGVAAAAPEARDPDELLRLADTAMYRAKAGGKGRSATGAMTISP